MEIKVKLNSNEAFEIHIAKELKEFIDNKDLYYNIFVSSNKIIVTKQSSDIGNIDCIEFNTSTLRNDKGLDQVKQAVAAVYHYTFSKLGDLNGRCVSMKINQNASINEGTVHTFYHDKTGIYPESIILNEMFTLYKDADQMKIYSQTKKLKNDK